MDFIPLELLGEAVKADVSQKLVVFAVIWWFVRKTISKHFKSVEDGLNLVAQNVSDLKIALTEVEKGHSRRLGNLEQGVSSLDSRVKNLEQTK